MNDIGPRPSLTLLAAVARNGAIGRDNALLWREPEDQRHFRRLTMGHPVLMGRRTWESLPARFRPLPGRRNLVLTRQAGWHAEGAETAASIDAALARLADLPRAFVIGGAEVYAAALPLAETLVLTEIDADLPGDVFFPAWDRSRFRVVAREARTAADGTRFTFATYRILSGD